MDDLTKYLYEYLTTNRYGSVWDNPEYRELDLAIRKQTERVEEGMSWEQRQELDRLLEHIAAQGSLENRHLFQAALNLFKELNALVRA